MVGRWTRGIGFPVWAIVDDATGQWLDAWVVPSNRMGGVVLYLFLCAVEDVGGMPLQITTDCGSETTQLHAMAKALRVSAEKKGKIGYLLNV